LLRQAATVQQPVTIHWPVSEQVDRPIVQARRDPPAALAQIQEEYIAIRKNGGASAGTISTARWCKAPSAHWPETRIIRAQCKTLVQILGRPAHCLVRGLGAMLEVCLTAFGPDEGSLSVRADLVHGRFAAAPASPVKFKTGLSARLIKA
jgi:hypothetical protein